MAWCFILCAFPWIAVGRAGIAIGLMFFVVGLLFLRSVSRRERAWQDEPIQPPVPTRGNGT